MRLLFKITFFGMLSFTMYSTQVWSAEIQCMPTVDEPSVHFVQQRALAYARLDPAEVGQWKRRVGKAPWLPRLQLEYFRRAQDNINVTVNDNVYVGSSGVVVGPEESKNNQTFYDDNRFGVRATWQLDELVFSRNMLAVSAEARQLARERDRLLSSVNKLYYDRRQYAEEISLIRSGKFKLKSGETAEQATLARRMRCAEATAGLNALTGGWFSREGR